VASLSMESHSAAVWRIQAVRLGREMGHAVLTNYTELKAVTAQL
jgi:hypothetical protein